MAKVDPYADTQARWERIIAQSKTDQKDPQLGMQLMEQTLRLCADVIKIARKRGDWHVCENISQRLALASQMTYAWAAVGAQEAAEKAAKQAESN
jgi:hypothetical protein